MKRWILMLAMIVSSTWASAQSPNVTLTGIFQGPNGLPAANNILSFTPTQPFFVAGTGANPVGAVYIFGNPAGNQTLTQPINTHLYFNTSGTGTIDFTGAVVSGLGSGLTPGGSRGYLQSRGPSNNLAGEQIVFADQWASGTAIDAAFTACNATPGCWLIIPPGSWTFSTSVTPTFPMVIQGAGASYQNAGTHCTTTLTWTGGASAPLAITGTAASGTVIEGLCLNATGTAPPVFIDIDNGADNTYLDHIAIDYPTVGATVAGIRWGNSGFGVNDSHASNIFLRNTAPIEFDWIDIQGQFKGYNLRGVGDGTNGPVHPGVEFQLGSATQEVSNFNCFVCDANADVSGEIGVLIYYADTVNFFGPYFEQNGTTGFAVQIPSAANGGVLANGINLYGPRFQSSLSNSTEPIDVELTTAKVNVNGGEMLGGAMWSNPNYLFKVGGCASITSTANQIPANGSLFSAINVSGCGEFSGPGDTVAGSIDPPVITKTAGVGPYAAGQIVAFGTSTLSSGALTTGTCSSVVTTTATGALTSDSVAWSFASAPTSSKNGLLNLVGYVSAGHVNWLQCNPTANSVTPDGLVINWSVVR